MAYPALNRRNFVTLAASSALTTIPRLAAAQKAAPLTGVTWGGPWVQAARAIAQKSKQFDNINWQLHEGSTTAIVAKVKSTWPRVQYDFIVATSITIMSMMNEGWLEPLDSKEIPSLASLNDTLFISDAAGHRFAAPTNESQVFWIADEQALGFKPESPDDLFNPKMRGKMLITPPPVSGAKPFLSLALARGGSEDNMDPGFEFVKELAKAKIIGRIAKTDVEIANAFTTGEILFGMVNSGNYHQIRQALPHAQALNKVPGSKMFKAYLGSEQVVMLKREGDRQEVKDFLNFFLNKDNNTYYSAATGTLPSNVDAEPSPELADLRLATEQERRDFGYLQDPIKTAKNLSEWNKRWELDIAPLLG